ncbi:hypothetical protein CPT_Pepon028 [Stenotrophomonas phage Pepon]|uniref:Uncharacterized protein n=1 Tax=Stenotrophomonas phage Pepon TaxID=2859654 RepID=A0AAE8BLI2_9CAUD|nr:hypothetical protein CPT_Pepon028 [Stenotrophomonas phage Pepon]
MATAASKKHAENISRYYDQQLRRGFEKDDAVEYAIRQVWPLKSEDAQADIFAAIRHVFDEYPSGVSRKIALSSAVEKYRIAYIHG